MKKCGQCGVEKFDDAFYVKDKRTGRLSSKCKDCEREAARRHYERNSDRIRARVAEYQRLKPEVQARSRMKRKLNGKRRLADIRIRYGLSAEDYARLLSESGGMCEICGRDPATVSSKGVCVDHCHKGGGVRGLLCHPCNAALGNFRDDVATLRAAIRYLEGAPSPPDL